MQERKTERGGKKEKQKEKEKDEEKLFRNEQHFDLMETQRFSWNGQRTRFDNTW